jgi:hypothetical protein
VLEIVEGEAIGWSRCARARSMLNGMCHAPGAGQHGLGVREKPLFVEGLCRALGRGLDFLDAGLRPSMGPS